MTCPRYFGYTDVPDYEGHPLLSARGDPQYEFYCAWLATYLERIAVRPVPDCQAALCAKTEMQEPVDAAFWLGHDGFYHLLTYEGLEGYVESGVSYEDAEDELRANWEDTYEGVDSDLVEPLEEWINPRFWSEAKREYDEQRGMPLPVTHADVGYRLPLARAMARVGSAEERIKLIKTFYDSFIEEAAK